MYQKLVLVILLLISSTVFANDKKPEKETTIFDETFSWDVQAGVSIAKQKMMLTDVEQNDISNYLNVLLLVDLYYKGFFVQSNYNRFDTHTLGGEIGYQLHVAQDWELDLIAKSYFPSINPEVIMEEADKEIPILQGLKNRSIGEGLALRYTRYLDSSFFSVDLAKLAPVDGSDDFVVEGFYSHLIPYRNWDVYLNGSLTYYAQGVMDYYYGISAEEANELRPEHEADSAFKGQVEVFVQHPLSESWTFSAGLSYAQYSNSIEDSPLISSSNTATAMMGVLYVF